MYYKAIAMSGATGLGITEFILTFYPPLDVFAA
jgi:hypothetical protein